eukprot:s4031_g2.t1
MPGMPAVVTGGGSSGADGDYHAALYNRWQQGGLSDEAVQGLVGEEMYAVFVAQRMEEPVGGQALQDGASSFGSHGERQSVLTTQAPGGGSFLQLTGGLFRQTQGPSTPMWLMYCLLAVLVPTLLFLGCWSLAARVNSHPASASMAAFTAGHPRLMAVLLETNLGDLVIDLKVDQAPTACLNFVKLCKMKYYNNCLFMTVEKDFIARTGDPTNTGRGGCCVHAKLPGIGHRFFKDEIHPALKHNVKGTVGMANEKPNENGSQFYATSSDLVSDHCVVFSFLGIASVAVMWALLQSAVVALLLASKVSVRLQRLGVWNLLNRKQEAGLY